MVKLDHFVSTTISGEVPDLSVYLLALWYEKRGDWQRAHEIVQELNTEPAALIHAYLHRREGDDSNARYWYHQVGRQFPVELSLDEEWSLLATTLLATG
ncbi:MAG: hypothetical protein EBU88_12740 [Acidobacteria bacterium]|nr:hypothetical protein [Acidobacteriota bacterium]